MAHGCAFRRPSFETRDHVNRHVLKVVRKELRGIQHPAGLGITRRFGHLGLVREVGTGPLAVNVCERSALVGVVYDDPAPALRVGACGCLLGQGNTVFNHVPGNRALKIKSFANGSRCRKQFIRHCYVKIHSLLSLAVLARQVFREQPGQQPENLHVCAHPRVGTAHFEVFYVGIVIIDACLPGNHAIGTAVDGADRD